MACKLTPVITVRACTAFQLSGHPFFSRWCCCPQPITVILVHADLRLNICNKHNSLTYVSCIILFLKKQACTQRGRGCMNLPTAVRGSATGSYKKYQDGNPIEIGCPNETTNFLVYLLLFSYYLHVMCHQIELQHICVIQLQHSLA